MKQVLKTPHHQIFMMYVSLLMLPLLSFSQQEKCTIKGSVVNRSSKNILLLKGTESLKTQYQIIPIVDNSFEYTFSYSETEAWQLVFEDEFLKGAYKRIEFFPDTSSIQFTLYPAKDFRNNRIKGGALNREDFKVKSQIDSIFGPTTLELNAKASALFQSGNYFSHAYDSLQHAVSAMDNQDLKRPLYLKMTEMEKKGEHLSVEGKKIEDLQNNQDADRNRWKYNYIKNKPSIVGYYQIWRDVYAAKQNRELKDLIKDTYPIFAAKFPHHSYTIAIGNELNGLLRVQPGERFIDFSAPDPAGNRYTLSEQIKGKVTLIDFWGSWCAPCIAATKTMLPVYNEFKDKGFMIIGIAREFKALTNLNAFLRREKYPWLNLVDLDDKNKIWNKYAISNTAGMMLLVDKSGKILAVDPTAEQVREILGKSL